MHGRAEHTKGKLTMDDLEYNKLGRIVSKRRSKLSKQSFANNPRMKARSIAVRNAALKLRATGKLKSGRQALQQINKEATRLLEERDRLGIGVS